MEAVDLGDHHQEAAVQDELHGDAVGQFPERPLLPACSPAAGLRALTRCVRGTAVR
jgi:hypothetical protein